jgi:hypothetical protein
MCFIKQLLRLDFQSRQAGSHVDSAQPQAESCLKSDLARSVLRRGQDRTDGMFHILGKFCPGSCKTLSAGHLMPLSRKFGQGPDGDGDYWESGGDGKHSRYTKLDVGTYAGI